MALSSLDLSALVLFSPHQTIWLYLHLQTIVQHLSLLIKFKMLSLQSKCVKNSYLSNFVDSKQNKHVIPYQSRRMALPHYWIVRKYDGFTDKSLTVDSVQEVLALGALCQSPSHNIQITPMNSCCMAPPSCRVRRCLGFEFPPWSEEGTSFLLNLHLVFKYYHLLI